MPDNDHDEWPWEPVGPHIDLLTGFPFSSSRFTQDTNHVRLCRGINVTTGCLRWGRDITRRWPEDSSALQPFRLKPGDIVVGMDGSLVGHNYAMLTTEDVPSLLVQRVARLRAKDGLNQQYLFHFFSGNWFIRYSEKFKTSTAIPHITPDDIRSFQITRPSLDEQAAIAAVLDTVDEAIGKTEQVIAKLKQVRAGLLHDLLTRGLDEHGQLRDPLAHPEQFQDSKVGRIPRDWTVKTLAELCIHIGSGVTPRGGQDAYTTRGVMFIRSQNVTFDGLLLDDVAYISDEIHLGMLRSEVFAYDVLFNITGASIGRCCPMPDGLGKVNVNQHVCALRVPDAKAADAKYLASLLASPIGQRQMESLLTIGNRQGLNYQQLGSLIIPWPNTAERERIASGVHSIEGLIGAEANELAKLQLMKSGLMTDLLTGRVPVPADLLEETAQ